MKIGIDARLWMETGVGRYIRNLVKELQLIDKKNDYILFVRTRDYDNIKASLTNTRFHLRIADVHWHSVAEQIRLPLILNQENLDLVHFPYFSIPIAYRRPYVITIHDLIIYHYPTGKSSTLPLPFYQAKHFSYKRVVNRAAKHAKRIIAPLQTTKDDIAITLKIPEDKISVTYEGFDSEIKADKASEKAVKEKIGNKPYFLYVGNAFPHKNLTKLIDAYATFRMKNPDYQLYLLGGDDFFYNRIEQYVHRKSITGVHFFHEVNDSELHVFYKEASALVSPSKMEGFGLTPLEAMSSQCPVAVSDIPSFREVCADAAVYFDHQDEGAITQALEKIATFSESDRQKLIKKGLENTKRFSWQTMGRATLSVYESSLSLR
jgi:glycosyltransferase involved in cell wall biosynthesis